MAESIPPPPPPSPVCATPHRSHPPQSKTPMIAFQLKISEKLDQNKFLVWHQQVKPMISAHNLHLFIEFPIIPSQFLTDIDCSFGSENPEYRAWIQQDQGLLSWLSQRFLVR